MLLLLSYAFALGPLNNVFDLIILSIAFCVQVETTKSESLDLVLIENKRNHIILFYLAAVLVSLIV